MSNGSSDTFKINATVVVTGGLAALGVILFLGGKIDQGAPPIDALKCDHDLSKCEIAYLVCLSEIDQGAPPIDRMRARQECKDTRKECRDDAKKTEACLIAEEDQ